MAVYGQSVGRRINISLGRYARVCSDPNLEILGSVPEYRRLTRESGPCQLRVIAHDKSPLLS